MIKEPTECYQCKSKDITLLDDTEELKQLKVKGVYYYHCNNCNKDCRSITNRSIAQNIILQILFGK